MGVVRETSSAGAAAAVMARVRKVAMLENCILTGLGWF